LKKFLSSEARIALTKSGGMSSTSSDQDAVLGRGDARDGLQVLVTSVIPGEVRAVVQSRYRRPVDVEMLVDLRE
jgi:hypothetical protein